MRVVPLTDEHVADWFRMREQLFPDLDEDDNEEELEMLRRGGEPGSIGLATVLIAMDGDTACGFAEAMVRSHGEGCWDDTMDRMGIVHLEGWYVDERARGKGVGRLLVDAVKDWAREQGSPCLASNVELDNDVSQKAHEKLGFEETDRLVHYRMDL